MIAADKTRNQIFVKPSLAERRWVLLFATLVIFITMLPYLMAYSLQGEQRFTGAVLGVEDMNSYIAKMLSGSYGEWIFRTPYTAYPQKGVVMFVPYILLGKLAGQPALHEQLVVIFHIFRVIAGYLLIFATYDFIAFFISKVNLRRFGLALTILGGGLGWVLIGLGQDRWFGDLPLEFYSPETFGFLALFSLPHLAAGRAMLLWALLTYLQIVRLPDSSHSIIRSSGKITILWLLGGLMQPLIALVTGAVFILHLAGLGIWSLLQSRKGRIIEWSLWRRLSLIVMLAGILPGFFVLYNAAAVFFDPFLQLWTSQNYLPSPHPLHYLSAFILVLPYAGIGAWRLLKAKTWLAWLLVGWVLAFPFLAYAPIGLQRRLPEGIWVALVVLAMAAFDNLRPVSRRLLYPLLLAFPSTIFILVGGFMVSMPPAAPVFRPAPEVAVFEYLAEYGIKGEVVLTSFETGNALPAWAPLRIILGHGPESVEFELLKPRVAAFYGLAGLDAERRSLLSEYEIRYVFWGPAERALGSWDPHQAAYLAKLHQVGEYAVFEVANKIP